MGGKLVFHFMDALAEFKRMLTPNGQRLECKLQENEGVFRSISQITLEENQSRGRKNGGETRNEWYPALPGCKTSGLVTSKSRSVRPHQEKRDHYAGRGDRLNVHFRATRIAKIPAARKQATPGGVVLKLKKLGSSFHIDDRIEFLRSWRWPSNR